MSGVSAGQASSSRAFPSSDVFRPRFPIDPYAHLKPDLRQPWSTSPDRLPSASKQPSRDVLLVLGDPSSEDLAPLLHSERSASHLLVVATHHALTWPEVVYPTVRVLRLAQPLALEDSGTARFVRVLEWAERVARVWRAQGGSGVHELRDEDDGEALVPPAPLFRSSSRGLSISAGASHSSLQSMAGTPSATLRPHTPFASKRGSLFGKPKSSAPQRPFDAIVNFVPASLVPKAQLKQVILLTTVGGTFMAAKLPPAASSPRPARALSQSSPSPPTRRPSLFRVPGFGSRRNSASAASSLYASSAAPSQDSLYGALVTAFGSSSSLPPRIVHVLPDSRNTLPAGAAPPHNAAADPNEKLAQSIESFLTSSAYPPTSPADELGPDRARPFLMRASTFRQSARWEPEQGGLVEYSVADLVLSGALDPDTTNQGWIPHAWISDARVIMVQGERGRWRRASSPVSPTKGKAREHAPSSYPQAPKPSYTNESRNGSSSTLYLTPPPTPPIAGSRALLQSAPALSLPPATASAARSKSTPLPPLPLPTPTLTPSISTPFHMKPRKAIPTPPDSSEEGDSSSGAARIVAEGGMLGTDGARAKVAVGESGTAKAKWKFWRASGAPAHAGVEAGMAARERKTLRKASVRA